MVHSETTIHNPGGVFQAICSGHWEIKSSDVVVGKQIGEGSDGVVHLATMRGRPAIAKKLRAKTDVTSRAYKDLIMELDVMMYAGNHQNLVEFYGAVIEDREFPVILEEHVTGPSLSAFLSRRTGKQLERRTTYGWSVQLLSALKFLHTRDPIILHRDLKPSNIVLTADGSQLKVADFGMSKKVKVHERETKVHAGNVGTDTYMAPELVGKAQAQYNETVDIYSASLIIYYIASSWRAPFKFPEDTTSRPKEENCKWPELGEMLVRMWSADPRARPSAAECMGILASMGGKPDLSLSVAPDMSSGCACEIQ